VGGWYGNNAGGNGKCSVVEDEISGAMGEDMCDPLGKVLDSRLLDEWR